MANKQLWYFINSFAPWLSAIGTIFAVIISLYLALRNDSVRLKVAFNISEILNEGEKLGTGEEYFWITVTNMGRRAATLNSIYFKCSPFKKEYGVMLPPHNSFSSRLPVTINDGQSANYAFPIKEFLEINKEKITKKYLRRGLFLRKMFARLCVSTSTGTAHCIRINNEIWKEFGKNDA